MISVILSEPQVYKYKNKVNLEIPTVNVYAKCFLLLDLMFTASNGYNNIALNGYAC